MRKNTDNTHKPAAWWTSPKHLTTLLALMGGGLFLAVLGFYTLSIKLAPVPASYLNAQELRQALSQTELALHKAHLSEDQKSLMIHLEEFTRNFEIVRAYFPESPKYELDGLNADLKQALKQHAGLKVRLETYLYVIDNAHQEFQKKLTDQTDKAYFNLVSETDRSDSVSHIVNNYVTPLISTAQLGTDLNLIVANLEKARQAEQKLAIQNLKESSDKALKQIHASFNLHGQDPGFTAIEDITYQITSFAHSPNNIFEIRRKILDLDTTLTSLLDQYSKAFSDLAALNQKRRSELAGQLIGGIERLQIYMLAFIALNTLIFLGALFYLFNPNAFGFQKNQSPRKDAQEAKDNSSFAQPPYKQDPGFRERIRAALSRYFRNQETTRDKLADVLRKSSESFKARAARFGIDSQASKKESLSEVGKTSEPLNEIKSSENRTVSMESEHSDESMSPLLLDTTMRIEAQRQKLKQALAELDDNRSPRPSQSQGLTVERPEMKDDGFEPLDLKYTSRKSDKKAAG